MPRHGVLGTVEVDKDGAVVTFDGAPISVAPQNAAALTRRYLI
jgi:hypothetical protein